jgi:hypothetical protein
MAAPETSDAQGCPRLGRRAANVGLLAGAIALAAFTAYRTSRVPSVVSPPPVPTAPVAANEAANRRQEFAGTFATGNRPGDRILTLEAGGRVEYAEIGAAGTVTREADAFQVGKRGKRFALATKRTGVIEVVDLDTLTYWGDTYRRR